MATGIAVGAGVRRDLVDVHEQRPGAGEVVMYQRHRLVVEDVGQVVTWVRAVLDRIAVDSEHVVVIGRRRQRVRTADRLEHRVPLVPARCDLIRVAGRKAIQVEVLADVRGHVSRLL